MNRPPLDRALFSVADAARACGLTEASLRGRIQKGTLAVVRMGRRVLIPREVLDELVRGLY